MLDSQSKLKNFILWCQKNKVKSFKNKEIEFELSELAFVGQTEEFKEINLGDQNTFSDTDGMSEEERDELLFWSTNRTPAKK